MGFGGGAFGTGSYTFSVIDNQTIKLNQQEGVIYANSTISEMQNAVVQNGAISGTIAYSEPATGKYYKKFLAVLSNFQNQNQISNLLSNSGTSGIGEAPQLSSTYAQYDNGASVFNFYDNFAGTSLNTSWSSYAMSGGAIGTITVNNGLTLSGGTNWWGIKNTYTASSPSILEYYGEQTQSGGYGPTIGTYTGIYFEQRTGDSTPDWGVEVTSSGAPTSTYTHTGSSAYNTWYLVSGIYNSGAVSLITNYITTQVTTTYSTGSSNLILASFSASTSVFQYVRVRAYPPNGVMPSVSFGSFTSSSGASITIPSRINYYMPITITNNQSSATPSPFQQMIQININNYSNYMYFDGNIANFEFFTSTGEIIPAWIESNNNGTLTIWVKLSSGIGANSSITIYLGVAITVYQYSINYPVPFTTEANIIYNSGINASTTLSTLTISLTTLQQATGTIIVEGY